MIILGIDTSCDDTCISIIRIRNQELGIRNLKIEVLSNLVSSQVKIHQKYGGVYPTLAKREHQKNLVPVLKKALREANLPEKPKIDAIAVTVGPGLDPCLWTGVNFAKNLAEKWNLPIIPVNHIEAHIVANWLTPISSKSKITLRQAQGDAEQSRSIKGQKSKIIEFPAVCLVVSGGHTQLILMKKIGDYKIIGETRDDAAGECFDETARVLGLPYPGGPAIAQQAVSIWRDRVILKRRNLKIKLPRPMIIQKIMILVFPG